MNHQWHTTVCFGDCDPAGIVFYPNFYRWFDAATHAMFWAHGYSHQSTLDELGLIGWPLIETSARFKKPLRVSDTISIHSQVGRWSERSFWVDHEVRKGDEVMATGQELRFFGLADPVLKAVPIPEAIRALFEQGQQTATAQKSAVVQAALDHPQVLLLDSIGYLAKHAEVNSATVIVCGSHGGTSAAGFVLNHSVKPRLVFFNDAGGGKNNAGTAGLAMLQNIDVAAACYSHTSAQIGDAADGLHNGQIMVANKAAASLGVRPGSSVLRALEQLLGPLV
jgi:4-hydroxybenzoyl-CoA thioesterase